MIKQHTFEHLFKYGEEECLFEISVGYDDFKGELHIFYVYDLEDANYENVDYWTEAAWTRFRQELINKLKKNKHLSDIEYNN